MKIHPKSAWNAARIARFLDDSAIPLRLACHGDDGFPVVCSLWFLYQDGVFWSASHKNAHIVQRLMVDPRAGFEVATNAYPYRGVRGRGNVELFSERAEDILERLIDRYLGNSNAQLADWLLSRVEDEFAIRLSPVTINAWDFSDRMERD